MLAHFMNSATSFRRDRSGNIGIVFGISLIPAVYGVGAAMDYSRFTAAKADAQVAADSVALALTKTLTSTSTGDGLKTKAQNMLNAYSPHQPLTLVGSPTLANSNSDLCITVSTTVNALISGMINSASQTINAKSCATAASAGPFEIALVLDNTGSMGNTDSSGTSKLDSAKSAAKSLIAQLNPTGGTVTSTISVVPFSTSVNVGTEYASMSWMDRSGASSIHWQNYTRPSGAAWLPGSRWDLFTQTGTTWGGCVEERPDPYLVSDTAASSGAPDTLYVPYLWPDEGDLYGSAVGSLPGATVGSGWYSVTYGSTTYTSTDNATNNYLYDFAGSCTASATDPYEVADVADSISKGSGATKVCKYKGVTGVSSSLTHTGPNYKCFSNKLLPLTQTTSSLNAKIDSMVAGGNTNLLPGFMWGWRTISPNGPWSDSTTRAAAPTGTFAPKAYTDTNNTKVIIFMTDGFNNWVNSSYAYGSEYNAFGYYANNRLSNYGGATNPPPAGGDYATNNYNGATTSSNWRAQMDAALLKACNNAKAAGVVVYTVGFSIPGDEIDTEGLKLLSQCASDTGKAYVSTSGTEIVNAFKNIGISLSKLRLKS